ncbi:hypothetical protein H0H92_015772 [Tricholoma furcatifolium]|nr:hypothetical protein H0H92_015772 [Tricholoma furcatifolium]
MAEVDLFEQGCDSLSATYLRTRIVSALHASISASSIPFRELAQNLVYSHPTIHELSIYLASLFESSRSSQTHTDAVISRHAQAMDDMINKYSDGLDNLSPAIPPIETPAVVLLTGSTGNLGCGRQAF